MFGSSGGARLPQYYSSYGAPGSRGAPPKVLRLGETKERDGVSLTLALAGFVVPWVLFAVLLLSVALPARVAAHGLTWAIGVISAVATVAVAGGALRASESNRTLSRWLLFLSASMLVAFVAALACGSVIWKRYTWPYEEVHQLNAFDGIDPARVAGNEVIDAGRISFVEGTRLNISQSMGFKMASVWCVAPIVAGDGQMSRYDFWAVGTDCCTGGKADFACAQDSGSGVPGALRAMSDREDEERALYRLAVQQAEATHKIKAQHPLFFTWTPNSAEFVESERKSGESAFLVWLLAFGIWQFVLAACAACSLGCAR